MLSGAPAPEEPWRRFDRVPSKLRRFMHYRRNEPPCGGSATAWDYSIFKYLWP
jgi:hypothetical protein